LEKWREKSVAEEISVPSSCCHLRKGMVDFKSIAAFNNMLRLHDSRILPAVMLPLLFLWGFSAGIPPLKGEVTADPPKPEMETEIPSGKGKGKGKGRSETSEGEMTPPAEAPARTNAGPGFFATITAVQGDEVTFSKSESGGGKGGMKGKGKGGGSASGGSATTLRASDKLVVTSATFAQRTSDLLVGIELAGGLKNPLFESGEGGGVKARIVLDGETITEINVIVAEEANDAPIAVKPKRPPSK